VRLALEPAFASGISSFRGISPDKFKKNDR